MSKRDLGLVAELWAIATARLDVCHANLVFFVTKAVTNQLINQQKML